MKVLLVLLGFIASLATAKEYKPGIRVKFGAGPGFGKTFCYRVSTTIGDALRDGWRQWLRPPGPLPRLTMYCPEDKTVCALFDDTGYIAGIQVALKDTFTNYRFDPITQGFTKWNTIIDGKWTSMWTLQQYFVSKDQNLKSHLKPRNSKRILQEGGIWLTGPHGVLLKVSSKEEDIKKSIFTEQGCFPGMGLHYFYNMTSTTECTAEQLYPWFLLVNQGELIAASLNVVGEIPKQQGKRDWFERPDRRIIEVIAPRGPNCHYDLVDQCGVLSMHIYYIDDPQDITC